ncbi:MAG TPA: hypothetical protein VKA67_06730, partial [Verrucomicrobiae bacterium]|nr:hypothetical protein [Verrucomicrobiae bacterium]
NVASDSYDSLLGPYIALNAGKHGNVASQGGLISVGNANINGSLYLGPNANKSLGPNGKVSGGIYDDFNMDFEDVQAPFTSGGVPPLSATINGTNYDYVLDGLNGGLYQLSSLKGTVYVTGGNNTLYVTGDATFNTIIVAPGASVQIYVAGANTVIGQVNNSGRPEALQYYGLPSNTSIALNGNGQFVGTIYAPNATFTANGGGSNTLDIMGGVVVNAVNSLNGHIHLHYDESLEKDGPKHYVIAFWHEMPI